MGVIKKCINAFRKMIKKKAFQKKLWEMDNMWYLTGTSSWELFPPSFYYTHTEDEIECITKETIERIKKMIEEME